MPMTTFAPMPIAKNKQCLLVIVLPEWFPVGLNMPCNKVNPDAYRDVHDMDKRVVRVSE